MWVNLKMDSKDSHGNQVIAQETPEGRDVRLQSDSERHRVNYLSG